VDDCDLRDLAAPYAVGALDDAGRERFEAHLGGCVVCTREVDALRDSLLVLAHASGEETPPPELRERVMAAVAREARADRAPERKREPFGRRRWTMTIVPSLAMAAAAIAAIVLLAGRSSTPAPLKALGSYSKVALRGAGGRRAGDVYVNRAGKVVALMSMPAAPAGKTYEAWVMVGGDETRAEPAGLFRGGRKEYVVLRQRAHPGDVVGFTLEPRGGSPRPTTQPLATASL
jgi:anti-sigma-K factor RskA